MYIIEGLITLVWAAICLFIVPKNFQIAYFLPEEDQVIMRWRAEAMPRTVAVKAIQVEGCQNGCWGRQS